MKKTQKKLIIGEKAKATSRKKRIVELNDAIIEQRRKENGLLAKAIKKKRKNA